MYTTWIQKNNYWVLTHGHARTAIETVGREVLQWELVAVAVSTAANNTTVKQSSCGTNLFVSALYTISAHVVFNVFWLRSIQEMVNDVIPD